jgi:hypothetical protein
VLGLTGKHRGQILDPRRAHALATDLGATHYILGNILEVGERPQVNASLDGQDGDLRATAEFEAKDETQLLELVDRLTAQLAVGQSSGPWRSQAGSQR